MELPEWASVDVDEKIVYVQTASQAFRILDYVDDSWDVVIEDREEHKKMILLMKGMGLR